MEDRFERVPEFVNGDAESDNRLSDYIQSMNPDMVERLSKPNSSEVFQLMERNIMGLLGNLPSEQFGVSVTTSREHLGRLLASAMMGGYFIRNVEQRMQFEKSIRQSTSHESSESE